jgi:hypothetical protein
MTRRDMAEAVRMEATFLRDENAGPVHKLHVAILDAAEAELRKSCVTCRYFGVRHLPVFNDDDPTTAHWCHDAPREVPADGFCHRWAK